MRINYGRTLKQLLVTLFIVVLISGNMTPFAYANTDLLKPADTSDETGNIVLHKQAERIGPDEWEINVKATIKEAPIEPPKMEVVFVLDTSGSMYACPEEAVHNLGTHFNHSNCQPVCGNSEHTHESSCYLCGLNTQVHPAMSECYYMGNAGVVHYQTRFDLAKQVIKNMISKLPEGTHIGRISFNDKDNAKYHGVDKDNPEKDPYDSISPGGATYMMDGVRLALNHEDCFTDDPITQKVMIVVTDGLPSFKDENGKDSNDLSILTDEEIDALYGVDDAEFKKFKEEGGIVYTVGFNHADENLTKMVANGGTYSHAANPDDMNDIFEHITMELTAMLVDPMGSNVGFEVDSAVQPDSTVAGNLSYDADSKTLYWNPSSTDSITGSSIEYSYKVSLNEAADMSAGVHSDIALNKPTSLLYGIKTPGETTMKSAAFPIPKATYEVSTMQVKWQYEGADIQAPTPKESVICDWENASFETDYQTITPEINGLYYEKTVITKNGQEVDEVDISEAADFVVTHIYKDIPTYQVRYEYTGDVPEGAPKASTYNQTGVPAETEVEVAESPVVEGYTFSGWEAVEGGVDIKNGTFKMPESNVKLQGRWERAKASVVVKYVDEEGNELQDSTTTGELYVGADYDVSAAKDVTAIEKDGKIYDFVSESSEAYEGKMSEGGLVITRVYNTRYFYYQVQYEYKGYDENDALIYTGNELQDVQRTTDKEVSVESDANRTYEGYDFSRIGDVVLQADLTGTAEDNPYVFVVEYEFHKEKTPEEPGNTPDDPSDNPEEPGETPDDPSDDSNEGEGEPGEVEPGETPDDPSDDPSDDSNEGEGGPGEVEPGETPDDEPIVDENENDEPENTPDEEPQTDEEKEETTPGTGDQGAGPWMMLMILAAGMLGAMESLHRRRN